MWDEVLAALEPLAFWGTWVVLLVHALVCAGVFALEESLIGYEPSEFHGSGRWAAERVIGTVGHTVAIGVATGIVVGLLLPATFGEPRVIPLGLLAEHWRTLAQCIALGVFLSLLVTLIPLVGALAAQSPGVTVYITSVCVFRGLLKPVLHPPTLALHDLFPDLWEAVGYGALAVGLVLLAQWGYSRLSSLTWRDERTVAGALSVALCAAAAAGAIGGVLPFFMYAAATRTRFQESIARIERAADEGFESAFDAVQFVMLRLAQFRDLSDRETQAVAAALRHALQSGEASRTQLRTMASVSEKVSSYRRAQWECLSESLRTRTVVRTAEYEQLRRECPLTEEVLKEHSEQLERASQGRALYVDDDGNVRPLDEAAVRAALEKARAFERSGAAMAAMFRGVADPARR